MGASNTPPITPSPPPRNQSLKRFVDPDDIAALSVFLASDSANSISGQTIPIDGDSKAAQ